MAIPGLAQRLRVLCKGPFLPRREAPASNSTPGRDVAFELTMCSHFVRCGFEIDVTHDADVIVHLGPSVLVVECKRPQTTRSLPDCYAEACRQVATRVSRDRIGNHGLREVNGSRQPPIEPHS
jgi:hypothetical protein